MRATPMDIGKPSSARTRARNRPCRSLPATRRDACAATSAKASSMEMRSMAGVEIAQDDAWHRGPWYSPKCPPTKTRSGQSCRARRPGMPLRPPTAALRHEAARTTPPPTTSRLAAQARVEQLFDRCIKGVEVRVENGGCGNHLTHHTHQRRRESRLVECRSDARRSATSAPAQSSASARSSIP